jgi:hypothetical protein
MVRVISPAHNRAQDNNQGSEPERNIHALHQL